MKPAVASGKGNEGVRPGSDVYPRRFGPYVLLKPLARGGMGALYLALTGERGMEKLCVIKTALNHLADRSYLQRFRDEAKVVVRLSHGNLVTVFDAGQIAGEIFLAMEFIEGKDLRAVWNRCASKGIAFPVDVAVHIIKELARGLGYAHSFGGLNLVHRDVSPPNLLLSYSGEVKLTDFGLASSALKLEKTAPGIIYGKVSYMAPEQARGEALDGRADLYSAAIMLWELLTGRQLFAGSAPVGGGVGSDDDVLLRVRHPVPIAPSQKTRRVPPDLDRIVLRALAPDPAERYQTCEEFRADLAAFLARTAPATDGAQVEAFLLRLFGEDIARERAERERLVVEGAALLPAPGTLPVPTELSDLDSDAKTPPLKKGGTKAMHSGTTDSGAAAESVAAGALGTKAPAGDAQNPARSGDTQAVHAPPAEVTSQALGAILGGRYRIVRLVGEGGMGRVYEAEHIDIGKRVAIKVLHPAYTRTPDVVERFRREARAASRIEHPNIVNVTDSGTTDEGQFFFVMEFIEGVELGLCIHREGPFSFKRTLRIADQICQALQAAHDAGIIHRDLKPENVLLLNSDGRSDFVKVLDFGIAKSSELEKSSETKQGRRLTRPGVAMGTPEYMAPEQAAGKPADPRSDIYALGSIMYEMLTGVPPYEGENVMEVLHKKATETPTPVRELRPDVPIMVEALVHRAMARKPEDRPQTMSAFALEIALVMEAFVGRRTPTEVRAAATTPGQGEGVKKPETGFFAASIEPVSGLRRLPFTRKTLWIGGAALGAVLSAAAAAMLLRSSAMSPPSALPVVGSAIANQSEEPLVPVVEVVSAPVVDPEGTEPEAEEGVAPVQPVSPELATAGDSLAENTNDVFEVEIPIELGPERSAKALSLPLARKVLREAQRLLHAQKYAEAGVNFMRLLRTKPLRGQALVGLGQIAFQQEKYDEAVKRARQAASAGGGVGARVLLGDAYFRLARYQDAHAAYAEALKLDPNNQVARKSMELVQRRMP